MKTVLDQAGRIALPSDVQEQLGIKPGDELALEHEEGKWILKRVQTNSEHAQEPSAPADAEADNLPANTHDDDLDWPDLDYVSVPLTRAGKVVVRIEQRSKLKPMIHDLDEE